MNTYWNHNGAYQELADELTKMIPAMGSVENPKKNRALEKFRRASNCYYDLYNNGLINRASEFARVFGVRSSYYRLYRSHKFDHALYVATEQAMNDIILKAAAEQRLIEGALA